MGANFMRKNLLFLLLILIAMAGYAQRPLTNSRQNSYYTYIYKIDTKTVSNFYKHPDSAFNDQTLQHPVDSFKTNTYWENTLAQGNYLKVWAEKNKLRCVLIENHSAFLNLLNNKYDVRFALMNKQGEAVKASMVLINKKHVQYDGRSGTYHVTNSKKKNIVQADYGGVSNFFIVKQEGYDEDDDDEAGKGWLATRWLHLKKIFKKPDNNNRVYRVRQDFTGFMAFNKPKYKPNDTVKFKAFILEAKTGKPITQKKLLVRLSERYGNDGKTIGTVAAYRDGGFEYSFALNDSLKLSLDRTYTIKLVDPDEIKALKKSHYGISSDGHKILQTGDFTYEDYDLKSIHFEARLDKKDCFPGDKASIYLKATDENGLPVPDGRVKLTMITASAHFYKNEHTFVPDTLWQHQLSLDALGETNIVIPDSVFPKADIDYNIQADFLNTQNEHQQANVHGTFKDEKYHIITELHGDTLFANYKEFGKEISGRATISVLNANDDTLSITKVILPSKTIINPAAATYNIETDSTDVDFELKDEQAQLSIAAERSADSVFIQVHNPRNIHFWYSVFAHNKLIDDGEANQLFYKKAYDKPKIITFLVNYVWAGKSASEQAGEIVYRDDKLNVNVKQPISIYPGQQFQTDILVTDATGKPVANTDITAWALTSKFNNYRQVYAPYVGRSYRSRKLKTAFETGELDANEDIRLNWARWSRQMGLDSITYYQFTHTGNIYRVEEPGIDTITQIAPFVVNKGEIIPVHIIYVDEKPVFFSQAQQLQQYSFMISPGKHSLRLRTSHQNIKLDSVVVEKSKKLILGINADAAPSTNVSDTLGTYEAQLINSYMITMIDNFDHKMATIKQDDHIFFLNPQPGKNQAILTGPLSNNYTIFNLQGETSRLFSAEPGYTYLFEPGLLKQKSIETKYPFNKILSASPGITDYTQYALTQVRADSIWQQFLYERSHKEYLFINKGVTDAVTGSLKIDIDINKKSFPLIKNIIIYRYDDPDFIRIYPGVEVNFGNLAKGNYRMLFLLKDDTYDIKENIAIKPFGINNYRMRITAAYPRDSVSVRISNIISSRSGIYQNSDYNIENDALKLKEVFNEKYLSNNGFTASMSGVVAGKDDKLPIVGASVKIKGTTYGAITDINGYFNLNVPDRGKLIISYIGYVTREIDIAPGTNERTLMEPNSQSLKEVVVVGYGVERRSASLSYSVTTVNGLSGKVSGLSIIEGNPGAGSTIRIRGISSLPGEQPLYIIDGIPVTSLAGINPGDIADINVLKSAAATALYGARAANGVVIINTNKQTNSINPAQTNTVQQADGLSIRKNFSDYAYWQPKLTTDANGKASFISTFPDDITNWRTFVIGINDQKQSGYTEHQIKSFKPLSAALITPLFAVQGDEFGVIGKVTNYNQDAAKLTRTFTFNGQQLEQNAFEVKNSKIDTLNITTPKTDSLTFEYTIKRENGYFDGERRKIPVIEQGVKETSGSFAALTKDTTISLNFDALLGPVTFRAEASALPTMAEEAQRLREYKYLCNEQLASKLKGLLAEKRIKTYLGEPFKWEKNILEVIKKLQDNRRSQGIWGWWKDTDEELWISLHAVEALTDAKTAGYTIDIDQQRLTDYLVYQMESYKGEEKLACLQLLHRLNAKVDYQKYFGVITKEFAAEKVVSKYDQFRLMLLQQETGFSPKMDSILMNEHHTLFGSIYWGEDGYRFFDNSVQLSVLAYKIIKNEGKHPELLEKIRGYLLEQRRSGAWRNTYESSLILETLLPDLLVTDKQVKPATLVIKGAKSDTVTKFPYTQTFSDKQLAISKTGTLPVYITSYQQFWNSHPEKVSKDFTVDTWFEKKGDKLTQLKGGEPVQLKVEVTAKGDADYVMIEIPIPAGCSYESKEQSWQNNEVHREYFKEKVSIFCRKLKQGKYEFTVNLIPRYDGKYSLNPAKAEMMYFPVFYGREGMKSGVIGALGR